MKRRIIGLLLALSCLFSVALAERPMRLLDVSPSSFLKKHPEIRAEDMVFDPFGDHLALMQSDNAPDLMAMYTMNDDLGAYKQANVLADLSQSEIIREAVSRMPQSAQAFVTDRDGRILALPLSHHIQPFYWLSDAWEAAGLTQADVPQSYTELLDFLESWLARIEQAPEKNICVTRMVRWNSGTEKLNYAYWLLSLLVHVQETQRCASAAPMPFESPDFIQAAERARTIGLSLYAAEPREKKRKDMLELFQNDINGGKFANEGRDYGLSHAMPVRLGNDQPAHLKACMELYFVRKGSPYEQEAIAYLEDRLSDMPWQTAHTLFTDFQAGVYDGCTVSEGFLEDLRAYRHAFLYPVTKTGYVATGDLLLQFASGKITALDFARGLDKAQE